MSPLSATSDSLTRGGPGLTWLTGLTGPRHCRRCRPASGQLPAADPCAARTAEVVRLHVPRRPQRARGPWVERSAGAGKRQARAHCGTEASSAEAPLEVHADNLTWGSG